jgi:hypothetical protein
LCSLFTITSIVPASLTVCFIEYYRKIGYFIID